MRLQDIGFYTLSDARAINSSISSPLMRCELILTDTCNFNCPYCRHALQKRDPIMPFKFAADTVKLWASEGLQNIRFSGGEPTLYKKLPELVSLARESGVKRIAISTNGSNRLDYYRHLVECGVSDFSISLDGCCSEGVKIMSGGLDVWDTLINNISKLSKLTYVTVGMVFNEQNVAQAKDAVLFAAGLGVSDIRVLSSAQFNAALDVLRDLPDETLSKFPILKYRVNNFRNGKNVRGIAATDSNRCKLVVDDMAVAGTKHFPCIIYLREGGNPIGEVGPEMRKERVEWSLNHDTHADKICANNCLDVCVAFNNTAERGKM